MYVTLTVVENLRAVLPFTMLNASVDLSFVKLVEKVQLQVHTECTNVLSTMK